MAIKKVTDIKDSVLTTRTRTSRLTAIFFNEQFRDALCPVTAQQYDFLRLAWVHEGLSLTQFGKKTGFTDASVSKISNDLVKHGYMTRKKLKESEIADKRRYAYYTLSTEGKELVLKYAKLYLETNLEAINSNILK